MQPEGIEKLDLNGFVCMSFFENISKHWDSYFVSMKGRYFTLGTKMSSTNTNWTPQNSLNSAGSALNIMQSNICIFYKFASSTFEKDIKGTIRI